MTDVTLATGPAADPLEAPLEGVRVLEFAHVAAGPFAGSLLADLGADVVKVEPPAGDTMRAWPPFVEGAPHDPVSANFAALNRNKSSISADLRDPEQAAGIRELCAVADVVVENYRVGSLARLGFGSEDLRHRNPGLIYCSISGYGQAGPGASRGAFDVTVQAASGLMSVTGHPGQKPVKCGVPVGDFAAGLYAATAVLAALHRRTVTGVGAVIDCSMMGALLGVSALQTSEFFATGAPPRALGTAHPRNAPYQVFGTADRDLAVAAGTQKLWVELCDTLGLRSLVDDARFSSQQSRTENQVVLADILQEEFSTKAAAAWQVELDRVGIANALVQDYREALNDPQVEQLGLVHELAWENGATFPTVGFPAVITGHASDSYTPPPAIGEGNTTVRARWLADSEPSGAASASDMDVTADWAGAVCTLTLSAAGRANSLTRSSVARLRQLLAEAEGRDAVAVVIAADGPVFCGGVDLGNADLPDDELRTAFTEIGELIDAIQGCSALTLACVLGPAIGAGADIVAACDVRVGTSRTTFRFPGAQFGLVLGSSRLAEVVGRSHALEYALKAVLVDADRAYADGLLSHLVADDDAARELVAGYAAAALRVGRGTVSSLVRANRAARPSGPALADSLRDRKLPARIRGFVADQAERRKSTTREAVAVAQGKDGVS